METSSKGDLDYLSALVGQYMEDQYFSGAVLRVRHAGLSSEQAWGFADEGEALTTGHLFDVASLSKLFTTVAILRLITVGQLSEHTVVNDVLKYTHPCVSEVLAKIDIVSLMTHSSGLRPWYPFYTQSGQPFEHVLSHIFSHYPQEQKPLYSDLNYMLLGKVVEEITHLPLDKAIEGLVLKPLKIEHATYHPEFSKTVATEFGNRIEERMTKELGLEFGAWRDKGIAMRGGCNDGNCFYYFGGVAGHAGIFARAIDVERLAQVFTDSDSSFIDGGLLGRALQPYGSGRGYGVQFGELYPDGGFGHTGFTGTYLYCNRQKDLIVTVLTNRLHVATPKDHSSFRLEVIGTILQKLS